MCPIHPSIHLFCHPFSCARGGSHQVAGANLGRLGLGLWYFSCTKSMYFKTGKMKHCFNLLKWAEQPVCLFCSMLFQTKPKPNEHCLPLLSAQTVLCLLTCFNWKVKEGQKQHFTSVLQLTETVKEWQEVDRNRAQGVTGTNAAKLGHNTDCHGYTLKSFSLFL